MRILIPSIVVAALLSSCSLMPVQTISRTELLTPTAYTALNPTSYIDMMYYGADDTYDYYTRSSVRYRVLRSENSMPNSARFTFNNWQNGKKYRDCVVGSVTSGLRSSASSSSTTGSATQGNLRERAQNWLQQQRANRGR